MDPCFQNDCIKECVANYCGGCSFTCSCDSYEDCKIGEEFCSDSTCLPLFTTVGEGEFCGGMIIPSSQCEDDLVCINTQRFVLDAGGICRRQCKTNEDCDKNQFCSNYAAVCLEDNQCLNDEDCSNSENTLPTYELNCNLPSTTFCSPREGTCVTTCGPINCYSFYDCPSSMTCDFSSYTCVKQSCESCFGPVPEMPNVICSDQSVAGPFCDFNEEGVCEWQIRECPTECVCSNPAPRVAACPNGEGPIPYCGDLGNNDGCGWIVPDCPTNTCDCSQMAIPMIAKQCDDGSIATAVCVSTPSGCSFDFECPNDNKCYADGVQCAHPIGGKCLGICNESQCILSAYDYCLRTPAVVFLISLADFTSVDTLISDLSSFSSLPKDNIQILTSSNREYNVEFVDSTDFSASSALSQLQLNINNENVGESTLKSAKIVVLTNEMNFSSSESNGDNNQDGSSSASLLITNLLLVFVVILF